MIYWFIGQPHAGKTTLAKMLKEKFDNDNVPTIHFDGDDLRNIFDTKYTPQTLSKEYRAENTHSLQKLISYIADQGINVIVSTVNAYKDPREKFKNSRADVKEIYVFTSDIRGREQYHVKDFEVPTTNYISIETGNNTTKEMSFKKLLLTLERKIYTMTAVTDGTITDRPRSESKSFDNILDRDNWSDTLVDKYGSSITMYYYERTTI